MCGITRKDRIRNEHIPEHLGLASIGNILRQTPLRCYRHVQLRPAMALARIFIIFYAVLWPTKKGGGLKKTWMKVVRINLKKYNNLAQDIDRNGEPKFI